jgi:hypothetical protein
VNPVAAHERVSAIERHLSRHGRGYYLGLVAAIVAVAWIPRLFWGFWLDETGTYWQAHLGWTAVVHSLGYSPGQSVLYGALTSLICFPGRYCEIWLRLPSVAAMLVAGYLVFRLASEWFGTRPACLALVVFLSERDIVRHAVEARPYALALAACLGLMYGLHHFVTYKKIGAWVLFTASAILIPHLHILFCLFFITPAVFILLRLWNRESIPWAGIALTCVLVAASAIPLRAELSQLVAQSHHLGYLGPPSPLEFLTGVLPPQVVFTAFLACIGILLSTRSSFGPPVVDPSRLVVTTVWLLSSPLLLALISYWRHGGIFIERYMLYWVVALCLLVGYFFGSLESPLARALVMVLFAGVGLASTEPASIGPHEWRAPLQKVRAIDPAGTAPVLIQSGFVESNFVNGEHSLNLQSYLYSALLLYPIPNRTIRLPLSLTPSVRSYCRRSIEGPLRNAPRIILMSNGTTNLTVWLTYQLEDDGYRVHSESPNGIVLLVFDKT